MKRNVEMITACVLSTSLVFAAFAGRANDLSIKPELVLDKIRLVKTQERDGDELYFTLSARVGNKPTKYIRIPVKPEHWLSGKISTVKKVHLWSEPLVDGQSVTVIVELNEQDSGGPLDPDDLLGVMRVKLKNEHGELRVLWDIPNQTGENAAKKTAGETADTHAVEPHHTHKFDLQNNEAHYEVHMSMSKTK